MSYEQAVEFVAKAKRAGKSPEETAQLLVQTSLDRGTMDNVTAIIVYLTENKDSCDQLPLQPSGPLKKTVEDETLEEDLMDVYQFLQNEYERKKQQASTKMEPESSKSRSRRQKYFKLPPEERVIEGKQIGVIDQAVGLEFPCVLERKLFHQGVLMLTQNYICFYSSLLGKKTVVSSA
jgi:hypothetical protein